MKKSHNSSAWKDALSAEADMELKAVGLLLAEARRRRGLSVSALAMRLGVDRRTLAQLERGSPSVSLGVFFQTLSMLDLLRGVDELVKPENDLEGIAAAIRRVRKRLPPREEIPDSEVDF